MPLSTPQSGRRTPHVLVVRAVQYDAFTPPLAADTGLVLQTAHGADDPLLDIAAPDVIVLDFPPAQPVDFGLYKRIHTLGRGRPIVVVGPRHETDCILTLELGADDYLRKPCAPQELAARIRAILRRRDGERAALRIRGILGGLDFDTTRRCLISGTGHETRLNTVEYELLRYLIDNPHSLHSRQGLAEALYHRQDRRYDAGSINVFINALRQKLRDQPPYRMIRTERGQGYVFTPVGI